MIGPKIPGRSVPLSEVATTIYSELKSSTPVGAFTRGAGGSPQEILDEVAIAIFEEIPVFGRAPPSMKLEEIPRKEMTFGAIVGGGRTLNYYGKETPEYVDLSVKRKDVRVAMKKLSTAGA